MKTQIVLIDYENVKPDNLNQLLGLPVLIRVFVGPTHARIPLELVTALQPFGVSAQYIQLSSSGKNALDFQIAYYLGRLTTEYPDAFFHIISKDTGFDPLVEHLGVLKVFCKRSPAIADIPLLRPAPADPHGRNERAKQYLSKLGTKPGTLAKLRNTLGACFGRSLETTELDQVLASLRGEGFFQESATGKLTYPF